MLPATERLARMPPNRWIGYTRASQAITLLEHLLEREPGRIRPRNLLIVGPTKNGKTAIADVSTVITCSARQRTASMRFFRCLWCKCHLRLR